MKLPVSWSSADNFARDLCTAKFVVIIECAQPTLYTYVVCKFPNSNTMVLHDLSLHLIDNVVISTCWGPIRMDIALLADMRPILNRSRCSFIRVTLVTSSPKVFWIVRIVSVRVLSSYAKSLRSAHSVILTNTVHARPALSTHSNDYSSIGLILWIKLLGKNARIW